MVRSEWGRCGGSGWGEWLEPLSAAMRAAAHPACPPGTSHQPGAQFSTAIRTCGGSSSGRPTAHWPLSGGLTAALTAPLRAERAAGSAAPIQMNGWALLGCECKQGPPPLAAPRLAGTAPGAPCMNRVLPARGSRCPAPHRLLLSWPPAWQRSHGSGRMGTGPQHECLLLGSPPAHVVKCYMPCVPQQADSLERERDGQEAIQFKRCGAVKDAGREGHTPRNTSTGGIGIHVHEVTGWGQRARRPQPQPSRLAAAGPHSGAAIRLVGPRPASLGSVVGVESQHPVVLQALGIVGCCLLWLPLRLLHNQQHLRAGGTRRGSAAGEPGWPG